MRKLSQKSQLFHRDEHPDRRTESLLYDDAALETFSSRTLEATRFRHEFDSFSKRRIYFFRFNKLHENWTTSAEKYRRVISIEYTSSTVNLYECREWMCSEDVVRLLPILVARKFKAFLFEIHKRPEEKIRNRRRVV